MQSVIENASSLRELEDGVSFCFDGSDEIEQAMRDLVLAERKCCAQFRYDVAFEPQHGAIELRVEATGPLVQLLKDLYMAFARKVDTNA